MKSRRIRKWEGDAREAVDGWRAERQLMAGEQRGVGGWTAERRTAEGWRGRTDRGSQHQTPEQRGEAAWDRVQRE